MTAAQLKLTLTILESHLRQTRAAYASNMPGVTYEDMAQSAARVLRMRATIERETGRPVRTKVTKAAIASLLRN